MVALYIIVAVCLAIPLAFSLYKRGEYVGIEKGQAVADMQVGHLKAEKAQVELFLCEAREECTQAVSKLNVLAEQLQKTLSQKKSSEVRTGLIVEQMAPFLEGFPYDPRSAIFLGKPLDFLVFDDDGVHFVEVKSGHAQLNANQRKVRDLIKEKKVTFEVYRIKGE